MPKQLNLQRRNINSRRLQKLISNKVETDYFGTTDEFEFTPGLKFYCGNPLGKDCCCLEHIVGLPEHPHTHEPMAMMPHQLRFVRETIGRDDRHQLKIHVNKSRQIGYTEIVLRVIQYLCFTKYAGGNVRLIAGTRVETAKLLMSRFKVLFDNIRSQVESETDLELVLKNGTRILALPSNSGAIRGDTKIDCIFIDEAAHFGRIDDSVVMDAIQPIIMTNKADIFMISTPNGPQGFFWKIDKGENDYIKLVEDIYCAMGHIYSKEDVEKELARTDLDVDQEYLNVYTSGRDSVFGSVGGEDTQPDLEEW